MDDTSSMDDQELARRLRETADAARNSEHRPHPCSICDLATLAEAAALRLEKD